MSKWGRGREKPPYVHYSTEPLPNGVPTRAMRGALSSVAWAEPEETGAPAGTGVHRLPVNKHLGPVIFAVARVRNARIWLALLPTAGLTSPSKAALKAPILTLGMRYRSHFWQSIGFFMPVSARWMRGLHLWAWSSTFTSMTLIPVLFISRSWHAVDSLRVNSHAGPNSRSPG